MAGSTFTWPNDAPLHEVTRMTTVPSLMHSSPAWWCFAHFRDNGGLKGSWI